MWAPLEIGAGRGVRWGSISRRRGWVSSYVCLGLGTGDGGRAEVTEGWRDSGSYFVVSAVVVPTLQNAKGGPVFLVGRGIADFSR